MKNYGTEEAIDNREPAALEDTIRKADLCPTPIVRSAIPWEDRVTDDVLRAAWSCYMWGETAKVNAPLLPACTWCGTPTGNWCESCYKKNVRPCLPICSVCEPRKLLCRVCYDS